MSHIPYEIQLHVFGDASEKAFSSVACFRLSYADGALRCSFVTARLEWHQRSHWVHPSLICKLQSWVQDCSTHFWTDGSTVLLWICGVSKRHPFFISNRIGEIVDTTEPSQGNHCPKMNPGRRGLVATSLYLESRWLNGPAFLRLPEENRPKRNSDLKTTKNPPDIPQRGKVQDFQNGFLRVLNEFLRVPACVPRLECQSGTFSVNELQHAR